MRRTGCRKCVIFLNLNGLYMPESQTVQTLQLFFWFKVIFYYSYRSTVAKYTAYSDHLKRYSLNMSFALVKLSRENPVDDHYGLFFLMSNNKGVDHYSTVVVLLGCNSLRPWNIAIRSLTDRDVPGKDRLFLLPPRSSAAPWQLSSWPCP
jgi:hypothetical protein